MKDIQPRLNPWITMWFQPRKTIRYVVNANPKMGFFFLSSIWFLQLFFFIKAQIFSQISFELTTYWYLTILLAIILSPGIGSICFFVIGWLLHVTGKWMKGTATQKQMRCVFAWSRVPLIIDLIMWFPIFFLIIANYYVINESGMSLIFTNLAASVTSVWSFVLLVVCVKEIQKFSTLKAFLNVVLVYVITSIILCIISPVFFIFIIN